ncbi:hypothetical protein [Thermohalobacter berrensis]|uniref:Uncharacterized protein n=1 Tax=Thermohalobacter berrensis TaxID=99594 RepID=A0A419SU53_9FIRM|nr:hypothetical protein [Thermohalobacter berrensis]RKD28780.1 hypothetical protein BET03_07010 [Thermohalobacter berrensis]
MLIINLILVFISTQLVIYSLFILIFSRPRAIYRLEKYLNPVDNTENEEKTNYRLKLKPRKLLNSLGNKLGNLMPIKEYLKKVQQELIRAGLPLKGEEFFLPKV